MAGGKGGNDDVKVDGGKAIVSDLTITNFGAVFGQDADIVDVMLITVHELERGLRVCKLSDLDLVGPLAKLAPHGI